MHLAKIFPSLRQITIKRNLLVQDDPSPEQMAQHNSDRVGKPPEIIRPTKSTVQGMLTNFESATGTQVSRYNQLPINERVYVAHTGNTTELDNSAKGDARGYATNE